MAEVFVVRQLAPYDAVAHRDGAAGFDVAALDEAADHHVTAGLDAHAGHDVPGDQQGSLELDVAVADVDLLDVEYLVDPHPGTLLTGESRACRQQQVRILGGEAGAVTRRHGALLAVAGGQGLARHGEAVDALGGGVPAHQQRSGLDGEQGAEVAHVHLAVIPLLGFEDPLGCGLHQPLQAGIQAVPGGLAEGDDGIELGTGCRLTRCLDGGGKQPLAHPLLDRAGRQGLLQPGQGQGLATPVRGDLRPGAHLVLFHLDEQPGILAPGNGDWRMRWGIRLCDEGVEQGDGFADPLAEGFVAPAVGESQQGQDVAFLDGLGEARGDAQADIAHVGRQLKPRFA